jgi:hypothetical protein
MLSNIYKCKAVHFRFSNKREKYKMDGKNLAEIDEE